jgi:hypothetical protein
VTHDQIRALLHDRKCPTCRRKKVAGQSFCGPCGRLLPAASYIAVETRKGDAYDEAFLDAVDYLNGLKKSRKRRAA